MHFIPNTKNYRPKKIWFTKRHFDILLFPFVAYLPFLTHPFSPFDSDHDLPFPCIGEIYQQFHWLSPDFLLLVLFEENLNLRLDSSVLLDCYSCFQEAFLGFNSLVTSLTFVSLFKFTSVLMPTHAKPIIPNKNKTKS